MALTQSAFRFYQDGSQSAALGIAAQNVDIIRTDAAVKFQYRVLLQDAGGTTLGKSGNSLQYSLNGGAYTTVGAATPIKITTSTFLTHDGHTTSRLTGGTGSYIATNSAVTSSTSSSQSLGNGFVFPAGDRVECLWALQLDAAQLSDGDTIDLRSTEVGTYTEVGRITYDPPGAFRVFVVD